MPTAADLADALSDGVDAAYKAVMKPAEGTILTVSRVWPPSAAIEAAEQRHGLWSHVLEDAVRVGRRGAGGHRRTRTPC